MVVCRHCHLDPCRCGAQGYLSSRGDGKPFRSSYHAPEFGMANSANWILFLQDEELKRGKRLYLKMKGI